MNRILAEQIKSNTDISAIISRYTMLSPSSRGYSGLCPFHEEHTPSFHVYTDTQSYYCFSCHEAGDVFTFLMKKNGMTFAEALEFLAAEAGIDIKPYGYGDVSRKRSLYDVMDSAFGYFRECFRRLPAGRAYLERRGFSESDADSYGLGYAPDSWDGLMTAMHKLGINDRELIEAGLIINSDKGMYDRFRGRLIFPVRNISGKIIAFGGRAIISDTQAKYINSPETEIYRKRANLYMLNNAVNSIRKSGYSILCEGYMDVLRLHKCGFTEAVASLGTSLTAEQAGLLKRYADRCYICYDSDKAGQAAAVRGMYILAGNGLDVQVVRLDEGKDPDEFLSSNPPESFKNALDKSLSLIEYHIEVLRPQLNDKNIRKSALNELWEGVKKIKPDDALRSLGEISAAFMLPHEEMRKRILSGGNIAEPAEVKTSIEPAKIDSGLECALCALLMKSREYRLRLKPENVFGLITDGDAQMTALAILSDGGENMTDVWRTVGDFGKISVITRGDIFLSAMGSKMTLNEKWNSVYSGLEALRIKRRLSELEAKMSFNSACKEDLDEFTELQRKRVELRI